MDHLCSKYIDSTSTAPNGDQAIVLSKLSMYEKKEKISILELAVWKVQCILAFASLTASDASLITMQDIEDYWTLEERFDPLKYRKDCRIKSGIDMCIEKVLEFLGKEF